jgi:lipopolysaccharide biosynthesis regulator YciM
MPDIFTAEKAKELSSSKDRRDWKQAIEIYSNLLKQTTYPYKVQMYSDAKLQLQMKLAAKNTVSDSTHALVKAIKNDDLDAEFDWANIDVPTVCAVLMNTEIKMNLNNTQLGVNAYSLLDSIHQTHPEWLESIVKK